MKKIIMCAALAVSLLSTQALAKDSGLYVGIDAGSTTIDVKASVGSVSASGDDSAGAQTFKVGYYFNENMRTSFYYQNINMDAGDASSYGVGFDYLIGSNDLKPFIGFIVGKSSISEDSNTIPEIEGTHYGAQIGLNYAMNNHFSFDLGYRYLKSNADATAVISNIDVLVETETVKNWYIGANYKF